MRKAIPILLIIALVFVIACAPTAAKDSTPRGTPTPAPAVTYEPPVDATWLSPGKVNITNYYAGGTAEYEITLHNGSDGQFAERKRVTTEKGETIADIPLGYVPAFPNRPDQIKVTSSIGEVLPVQRYHDGLITISGFIAPATRDLTIEYARLTPIKLAYKVPTRTSSGYTAATEAQQDWVIIADSEPLFYPLETKKVLVALQQPKGTEAPADKWEFWLLASPGGAGIVQTELVSKWQVAMRDKAVATPAPLQ